MQLVDALRNVDAERAVISAAFLKPEVLDWVEVEPHDFGDPRHFAIWRAMQSLRGDRRAVDPVTVRDALGTMGKLEPIGAEYVEKLAWYVPTADNVDYYVAILRELSISRSVVNVLASGRAAIDRGKRGEELLDLVQGQLSAIEGGDGDEGKLLSEAVADEIRSILSDFETGRRPGIPTGIERLDAITGGLPLGPPTILTARPSVGKSSVALNIADAASAAGHGVHVFTYEDRRNGWSQRWLANLSGVDLERIRSRTLERDEFARALSAAETLRNRTNIRIEHAHGRPVSWLVRRARSVRRSLGTRLVIVDYLQLMPRSGRVENAEQAIRANLEALANFAGEDELALLVLSQLNREGERRAEDERRPRLGDMRGSGAIEEYGKLILALHEPTQAERNTLEQRGHGVSDDMLEILALKNHQGRKGRVAVRFDKAHCRIGVM